MKNENSNDFEKNMGQLIRLLQKLIKNLPTAPGQMPSLPASAKDSDIQINFCFFNLFPLGEEDLAEFDEVYEQYLHQEEKGGDLNAELSPSDLDFLKRHGIKF